MKKTELLAAMDSLLAVGKYNGDGTWLDTELGFPLCDISDALEEEPEYFNDSDVNKKFDSVKIVLETLIQNNIKKTDLLFESLAPGRKLFPDKEKHWWWYLPDKLMNEEQLKEWKKYLKKRGYK